MSLIQQSTTVMVESSEAPEAPICMTQNPILRITLTGPTLVLTILAIIASIQFVHPSLTCTLIVLAPLPLIIHNDFDNFISLGPGGTPSTFLGYLKVTYLRLFALSDPYKPASFSEPIYPPVGYYQRARSWLPERKGPRPTIAELHHSVKSINLAVDKCIKHFGSLSRKLLRINPNFFELELHASRRKDSLSSLSSPSTQLAEARSVTFITATAACT